VICNSGTAFRARVDGRRLSFEEMGIFNGVFVMKDHQTSTMWSHYTGEAFDGPLKGKRLKWVQLERGSAAQVLAEHPNAQVPKRGHMRFRGEIPQRDRAALLGSDLPPQFVPTLPDGLAARLPLHTHGLGVAVGSEHRFYPLDGLGSSAVVPDQIGGVPVVVWMRESSASAAAYSRCVKGRVLSFRPTEHAGRDALEDVQTHSVWTATGAAVSGPMAGEQLTSVRALVTDWYGWAAYFGDTTVWSAAPDTP